MSGEALGWAKRQTAPCARSKSVLVALADYADEMGFAWPAVTTLATEAQLSERHIKRMLKALVDDGVILRCDVVDRHNGRTRACAYFFPISARAPSAKMLASYERKVGGRVTQVSPSEGDGAVTLEGDTGVTGRVTTVSPLKEPPLEPSEANASSASAREIDDHFEVALAAWPASGLDNTDVPAARLAFELEAAKVGDPGRLVAAVRAFAAAPETKARTFAPPGLDKWLSRQSYRGRLRAAKAARLIGGEPDLFATVPADVRAKIVGPRGEGERFAKSYLDPCGWDAERRTLLPANGIARTKLAGVAPLLEEMGVVLGEVQKGVA